MTLYRQAEEIQGIAQDQITNTEQHHNLRLVEIRYVWRDKAAVSKGRHVLGKARLIRGLNAFLAGTGDEGDDRPFFVMEIAEDTWTHMLDDSQRWALVDHELCHMKVVFDAAGLPELSIRGHDVEEFAAVIQRNGLWSDAMRGFAEDVAEHLRPRRRGAA
jgi:hypothetical protein